MECLRTTVGVYLTFSAAAAFAMARLTPRMALAPIFVLFGVPSSLIKNSSTFGWSLTSMFSLMMAGPMTSLTLATAFRTPFPLHLLLSPSRSSHASCTPVIYPISIASGRPFQRYEPVEAPDGTIARWRPVSVTTSTSTVGLPRES